jgi:LAO/AO transport system kinase
MPDIVRDSMKQVLGTKERILAGDIRSISRALSEVESQKGTSVELLKQLYPHTGHSRIIGVTGSPGAGKSTLVEQLARVYSDQGRKIGIIAVDPTSPFSGGAILGDRIRMQSLATNSKIFIRSMATRGKMGGLSAAVGDALLVLDAAGYEILIVETVGVGQDEVEIVKTADVTIVVLVPGMGDDIQTIKAGIMEIGDLFVINKADREGVERTRHEIDALLTIAPSRTGWTPPVLETVATLGKGVSELVVAIQEFETAVLETGLEDAQNADFHRLRLLEMLRDRLLREVLTKVSEKDLADYVKKIKMRTIDPYTAVDELVGKLRGSSGV